MTNVVLWADVRSDLSGTVVDAENRPVAFANIVLLSLPDSLFVQGTTSDEEGCFSMVTTVEQGVLKVSCVGYETQWVHLNHFQGIIRLKDDARLLDEVVIKGQLPKTKLTGNSMVTGIQGTVLGQSGTAKEMLAKVPGMTQKGDDLEVLGKGTPVFYINGRKLQNLDELKRLRSEEIREVEVVTNPGAQYDATVNAVVRIRTVRQQGTGFGYDVTLGHSQDLTYGYADPNAGLNLRYRYKNLDVTGGVDYWKWESVNDSRPVQQSYFKQDGQMVHIDQDSRLRYDWKGQGINSNLSLNWQIAPEHSVGVRVERHDEFSGGTDLGICTDMQRYDYSSHALLDEEHSRSMQTGQRHQPYSWEGNAYYSGKVRQLGIDLNVDFLTNRKREENSIEEWKEPESASTRMDQQQGTSSRLWASKLVLSHPLWKGQLQAGTEMSFVKRLSNYTISGFPLPTTHSDVREKNVAAFIEYGCMIPRVGSLSAGVRYEHVGFDYKDLLDAGKNSSRYTDEFFPSVSWAQQWGPVQTALSYSIKTVRPNYNMLDESVIYVNSYSLQQGNPKLKNETMQEVSLNVRWKWLMFYTAYERRDDALTQWSYIYNDEGIILIKNINLDVPTRNVALFLIASPTWGYYSPNWSAGWQKFFVTQTLADPREATGSREVKYTKPIMFFNLNNAFRFHRSWQVECNANIMTKGDVMNFRMLNNSINLNLVLQKSWLKNDALTLRATLGDILQRSKQKVEMDCGYYTLHQHSINNRHRLALSLRYTFNATQSKYKGTGAGKDAAGRMADGNNK